jgi:ribosomal protein S18 acetylase RimI-like enzyme
MMTIRRAVPGDLRTVTSILHSVARWLHGQGYDQWPDGSPSLGPPRIGSQIDRGEFWIVSEGRDPVAVIALSRLGDADFWSPAELAETAFYVSKAAVLRQAAGRGIGAMLLRWACDRAFAEGIPDIRLDVWKTNLGLQRYYRCQGWQYLRTVETPGRNSGALFWHPMKADPEAREAFALLEPPVVVVGASPVTAGMPVIVPTDDGPLAAVCTRVTADLSHGEVAAGWEHGNGSPPPLYVVERDGASWITREAWPDPAAVVTADL